MKQIPNKSFWSLWNISFGFFGVQIAYALQSANISSIFTALGADPHSLSFFWILPPLMGMIVQPIIGTLSDKTWTRFGRRIPYLFVGAVLAVAVMCLLPNAGSLGLTTQVIIWGLSGTMLFGLFSLMFLDTSINIAMQPFKMMVGDTVNEEQKGTAYAIQSALCNAGSLVGYLFPIFFTWIGLANTAPDGVIPDSVKWSFYIGAAILILCVLYTFANVREMDPKEYAEFHGIKENTTKADSKEDNKRIILAFATIGLVQFFCWAAFMYMWTYSNGAIASQCFGWDGVNTAASAFQDAGNWVGVCFAVQAVGSLIWAALLPAIEHKIGNKGAYILSLIVGGIGFISIFWVHDPYVLWLSYALIGAAWAAMLALPFTLFTNAIEGSSKMGTLLGLFNCTICLPQIVAALCGGLLLKGCCHDSQAAMLVVAGILLFLGALSVFLIQEKKSN